MVTIPKIELSLRERYDARHMARTSIFEYIVTFYNRKRVHGTITYMTPLAFLQHWRRYTSRMAVSPILLCLSRCPLRTIVAPVWQRDCATNCRARS